MDLRPICLVIPLSNEGKMWAQVTPNYLLGHKCKKLKIFQFYLFRFIGIALVLLNNSMQHERFLQHKKFAQNQFYIRHTWKPTLIAKTILISDSSDNTPKVKGKCITLTWVKHYTSNK